MMSMLLFAEVFPQIQHTVTFANAPTIATIQMQDNNTYSSINLNGAIRNGELGAPELPTKTIQLLVPSNATNFSLSVNNYTTITYSLSDLIAPVQEPIALDNTSLPSFTPPDPAIYSSNGYYPSQIATVGGKGIFRGNHILSIIINPTRYYPSQNLLEFYNSISLTLSYTLDGQPTNTNIVVKDPVQCRKTLSAMVANSGDINAFSTVNNTATVALAKSASLLPSDCDYVVVTTRRLAPAFDEFVFWKTRKGVKTAVVAIEDIKASYRGDTISHIYDDAGKLRQFLLDAYNNGGGIQYALLAADSVPIRYGWSSNDYNDTSYIIPTDLYFSDFDGNWNLDNDIHYGEYQDGVDVGQEILIGRIQPQNEWEVRNWTRKVLQYEKNPGNGNFSYLTKAFYIQADQLQQYNDARLIASDARWCLDTTIFEEEGGCGNGNDNIRLPQFPKGKDVIDKFNENFGFCGVFAHGSPTSFACATKGLNSNNIPVTTDTSKYSVMSLRNCYRTNTSIRENGNSYEDMSNLNYPTILYSISCHTNTYDMWDKYNIYQSTDRSMGDVYTCGSLGGGPVYLGNTRDGWIGGSCCLFESFVSLINNVCIFKLGLAECISKRNYSDYYLNFSHNLTGCPELEIWTSVPSTFNNVQIVENGGSVTVNTGGVDSCKICIMSIHDTGATFYEVREYASTATFTNVLTPYVVTITKHNYIPYLQALPDEYIQNETFTTTETRIGNNIYAGNSVTTQKPQGDVIIRNGATLKLKAQKNVFLENGFEVENGGVIEVNTGINN